MKKDKLYIKAFNYGYTLYKIQPELANSLVTGVADSHHIVAKGFAAGMQEYKREKMNKYLDDQRKEQTKRNKSPNKGNDKERSL